MPIGKQCATKQLFNALGSVVPRLSIIDICMGIGVALVWGTGIVFAKAAIAEFPPILLTAFRFLVTALAMVWFVSPPVHQLRQLLWIAFVAATVQYSFTFTGLKWLDASVAGIVVQLEVPFLVILGVILLRERPGARKWIGIAAAFIGVGLIAGEPQLGSAWFAILLVALGALSWAFGQIMVRRLDGVSGLTVTTWVAVLATPQLFAASLAFESDHWQAIQNAGPAVWIAVLYMGLIMTAFGYWLWYTLVRKHPVSQIAPFLLLLPVFSVLGGMIFLNERLTLQIAIGGAIVIGGVAFILLEPQRHSDAETEQA